MTQEPLTRQALVEAVAAHRRERGPAARVAFVLHPGGAAGAYQGGALAALAEAGLVPDLLVGTSIGAFNALGFWLDVLDGRPPAAPVEVTRLGRLWRRLGHRGMASRLLLDKPFLLRWITGRPDWRQGAAHELLAALLPPHGPLEALQEGLFTTERMDRFTRRIVADALGLPASAGAATVGHALAASAGPGLPTLVVVATDVGAHAATAFVLGEGLVAARLAARGHQAHRLGQGPLDGAAVLQAFNASASIPAVFPPVGLDTDPDGAPVTYVDGVVGNHRPFQLAVDAGATLIVSLEIEGPERPSAAASHFVAAAAEAFMTVADHFVHDSARDLAMVNRALARSEATRGLVRPLYRLTPRRRTLGLLDFDGRYEHGELVMSLFDAFMAGYAEAGGASTASWDAYLMGHARHGDRGHAITDRGPCRFVDATLAR